MGTRGRPRTFDRDAVLELALREFWQHGYEATTMADLSAVMGIRSASIYACFGSKESLFREALALYGRTIADRPLRKLAEGTDVRAAVLSMLDAYADAITDGGSPSGCLLTVAGLAGSDDSSKVRALLGEIRQQIHDALTARIGHAVEQGTTSNTTPAPIIARFLTSVLFGMSIQARDGASRKDLGEVISCAMTSWDALLGTDHRGC